jgi:EAL domain-containing protein (putative c-di-GMP-specific phosphodiesterase class I)
MVVMNGSKTTYERRGRQERRAFMLHPLASELAGAMGRDEVEVLFQPQFACEAGVTGAIIGAEALVRWQHAALGAVPGDELFRIAGPADLGHGLTRHVLDKALAAATRWPDALRLSLNVTAEDLAAPDFTNTVAAALARADFAPERLTLEITEQSLVADLGRSAERLMQLVDLGIRVALDDFGAGFCNFHYLKVLPLHYLKLDRSMVQGIAEDHRDLAVLRGIVAMASALDLAVVAEGIETEGQREVVAHEGCAAWQGYLGAKPMSAGELDALIAKAA